MLAGRHDLGMPAAAPLLAHGGVLRAADGHEARIAGNTDVAPDALADVLGTVLLDFLGQERVGDGGARRADQVEHTAADSRDHGVRRGIAPHAHHRFGVASDEGVIFLEAFLFEARGGRVIRPIADVHVPQVGQLRQHRHHIVAFAVVGDAIFAEQLVHGKAHRHGAAVADGFVSILNQLAQEAGAVLEAAAVLVRAVVGAPHDELHRQRETMGSVE
jgi:hypothetical protein